MKTVKRTVINKAKPKEVFAFMDDIGNIARHMTKSNTPMMGSRLTVE